MGKLSELKLNCVILEKGDGVGGTWYWNRYPGARCDTESHAYTYFFSETIIWSMSKYTIYINFKVYDIKGDI